MLYVRQLRNPPMRSRVVLGRGGPRGPPQVPKYSKQPPPTLPFSIGNVLKGNPFQILANSYENAFPLISNLSDQPTLSLPHETSVVHDPEIPNSETSQSTPKYQNVPNSIAPKTLTSLKGTTQCDHTLKLRGRSKSEIFNKKVKTSSKFTKKLKESFHNFSPVISLNTKMSEPSSTPPESTSNSTQFAASPMQIETPMETDIAPMEEDSLVGKPNQRDEDTLPDLDEDMLLTHPSTTTQDEISTTPSETAIEFDISPEEEHALRNHEIDHSKQQSSLQASISGNTIQPNIERFFTSKKTSNIPSVPNPSENHGANVDLFLHEDCAPAPKKMTLQSPPAIKDQQESHRKIPVQTFNKKEITCRFKIRIEGGTCNLPLLVKQVVKLYRGVDSSLTILPIENANNDALILDHEDSIPETKEELKKWTTNIVPHQERVHFTMRFSITKALHVISGPIFSWMKLNRSFVKMDTIKDEKIVTLGFFEGFHPDFQTRSRFKQYCFDHISSKTDNSLYAFSLDDFSIYPRSVYVGSTMDKVTTRAIVIEVGINHSSAVLQALSTSLAGDYSEVTFVPFTKMGEDYQVLLKMAMQKQNELLHSIKRKQIRGLINPNKILCKKDGQETTLSQWLKSARDESDPNSPIVKSVEDMKYSTSSILYYTKYSESIAKLCKDLKTSMEAHFPPSALSTVFTDSYSPAPMTLSRMVSDEETTWANIIKRKYLPNPKDIPSPSALHSDPPSKFRKSMYYGSTQTPSHLREDTHVPVTMISETQSVSSATSELTQKYNDLEKQVQSLLHSQEQITNETKTYVDNSIATMEENLNVQIRNNTDTIQQQISTMENAHSNQFAMLTQTLNAVAGNVNLLLSSFQVNANTIQDNVSTATTAQGIAVGSGKH